jgi:hypothetical protein
MGLSIISLMGAGDTLFEVAANGPQDTFRGALDFVTITLSASQLATFKFAQS